MKAQNIHERRKVLLRFLALFVIGILLVTIPFYFTIRLPQKENKLTSEELQILQEQVIFQRDYFAVHMDSVKNLLDSYDTKEMDIDKLNADIGILLSEMEHSFAEDTSWRKSMYENIVLTYLEIKKSKNLIIDVNEELSNCENNLKTAKNASQKPKTTVVN